MSGIFFDSSDLKELRKWFRSGILGGVTTNPVILLKEGVFDIPGHIRKMVEIVGQYFPISIEIPDSAMPEDEMVNLAEKYDREFRDNAVIKIPLDPRCMPKVLSIIRRLRKKMIKTNATLGITPGQLISAMEAGADYVSLFWGRCAEAGLDPKEVLKNIIMYRTIHKLDSKIIIGSIRNVDQITEAFSLGADIVTIKPALIEEWSFSKRGIETADEFNKAYRDVKEKVKL